MTKKERKKEFMKNRTTASFFERRFNKRRELRHIEISDETDILLEILKELQYINDK